nr:hypothetical protein [Spongiactinospora rosea]
MRDLPAAQHTTTAPVSAIDVNCRPRCDAECSPGRGYNYHPTRHSAGKPIIARWAFSWLAGESTNSWTRPLGVQRVPPGTSVDAVAAEQIHAVLTRLPRCRTPMPLFVFDGGYDAVRLALTVAYLVTPFGTIGPIYSRRQVGTRADVPTLDRKYGWRSPNAALPRLTKGS